MTTVAVFMDISKAYDSTCHTGLIYKLVSMDVPDELIRVIDSFLDQRSFRVKTDGAFSGWRPMLDGVPQG
jgi:Reverse transcriptase (RNA-dependent DNA polymerase).